MSLYRIFARPQVSGAEAGLPSSVVVREKFSLFAALLPPLWALVHFMWAEALVWLGITLILNFSALILGDAAFWLYVLFAVWIGFEAKNLRAASLLRKGYVDQGTFVASSTDMAEMEWVKKFMTTNMQSGAEA